MNYLYTRDQVLKKMCSPSFQVQGLLLCHKNKRAVLNPKGMRHKVFLPSGRVKKTG